MNNSIRKKINSIKLSFLLRDYTVADRSVSGKAYAAGKKFEKGLEDLIEPIIKQERAEAELKTERQLHKALAEFASENMELFDTDDHHSAPAVLYELLRGNVFKEYFHEFKLKEKDIK